MDSELIELNYKQPIVKSKQSSNNVFGEIPLSDGWQEGTHMTLNLSHYFTSDQLEELKKQIRLQTESWSATIEMMQNTSVGPVTYDLRGIRGAD